MSQPLLTDLIEPLPVSSSTVVYQGALWQVRDEIVDLGRAGSVARQFVEHPGAVGVLALDEQGRIPLVYQYRHPVGMRLWELPAGLLDVEAEPPQVAAARELAEEADLRADTWAVLLDCMLSPGGSSEAFRLFLARGLRPVPEAERHTRNGEELDMPLHWFGLDEVRDAVLDGRLHNSAVVAGVLAACAARDIGWSTLRPADAPWPEHPRWR